MFKYSFKKTGLPNNICLKYRKNTLLKREISFSEINVLAKVIFANIFFFDNRKLNYQCHFSWQL